MTVANPDPILREQLAYYRERAAEYDQWWKREGRYDRGSADNARWFADVAELESALEAFHPSERILDLACGTGIWSQKLLRHAEHLTVLDGSSEMLAINAARLDAPDVEFIEADLFSWQPDQEFDVVFFGFWLSHVPPEKFDPFWELVRRCLKPGGRFFFVDSLRTASSTAVDHQLPDRETITLQRRLNDGREFHIYKVFYEPASLQTRLTALGWNCVMGKTSTYFIFGHGSLLHT